MKNKNITNVADLQSVLKEMLKSGVETLLEAELDEELGYDRYSHQDDSSNYRNGKSTKRVRTDLGEIELDVPRDRNGEFEPQIVQKHANDLSGIEDKVISIYGKGMSQRDISEHIEDIYDMPISAQTVSKMTNKITPLIEEWQNRPLESSYPFVFMDATDYKVKQNNHIISKVAYVVVGINVDGMKDVLGIWIGENETSNFWLKVLTDARSIRWTQK